MRPTRSSRTAPRSPSTTRATAACRRGRARHGRGLGAGARPLRHAGRSAARCARASGSRATASSSTRPSSTRRAQRPLLRRPALHRGALPRPDGTPRDVGDALRNPDLAGTYRRIAREGAARVLPRRSRRDRRRRAATRRIGPDANHAWRPGLMTARDLRVYERARAASPPASLPRARRLGHGPAVERRLDGGRGAQHPRGLSRPRRRPGAGAAPASSRPSRFSFADRNAYLADPDFFDVPLRGPALRRLRRRAPRA